MRNLRSEKREGIDWTMSMRFNKTPRFFFSPAIPSTDQPNHLLFATFRIAKMSHTNSFNTNSYNNVWNNCNISDERSQILTWISPLEPRLRHQDFQDRRVDDVGEWLLKTEEFRSWYTGSGRGSFQIAQNCLS